MMRVGAFITEQSRVLLENKQQAIVYAVIFSILPFASWLSVALVGLITLRKGAHYGFDVLLPALVIHTVPLMMLIPLSSALMNTLIAYLPCYCAALALRNTEKWQLTMGVLFLQAFCGCLLIQLICPGYIVDQFEAFKTILTHYQKLVDTQVIGIDSLIWPQLFFGIQLLSISVSTLLSLMFARSIQARLFFPGGFWNEFMAFRSGKLALSIFAGSALSAYYEVPLAINIFPLVVCYFLVSGFCLVCYVFSSRHRLRMCVVLLLLLSLKPAFVLCAYIALGLLDSLVNFRLYLPSRVNESI